MNFSDTANDRMARSAAASPSTSLRRERSDTWRISMMCYVSVAIATGTAAVAAVADLPLAAFTIGAVLCGMAEAQGRCGLSHIGMIAPLRSQQPTTWRKCVWAYSAGGLFTSCVVGVIVSGVGSLTSVALPAWCVFAAAGLVGLAMLLRELGLVRFSPPQCDKQTHKQWMAEFGPGTVAAMWGSHIGLAVTTVITHGGLYPILFIVAAVGLGGGECLLVAFWLGRIIPLWLVPYLCRSSLGGVEIVGEVRRAAPSFNAIATVGVAVLSAFSLSVAWAAVAGSP